MGGFSDANLIGQRAVLTTAIGIQNALRDELIKKIERLKTAISSMGTYITEIEDVESTYNNLTIDDNRWKGVKKMKFDEQFDSLKENTRNHLTTTNEGKETMEDEKARLETELEQVEARIASLESSLASVNSQISAREA